MNVGELTEGSYTAELAAKNKQSDKKQYLLNSRHPTDISDHRYITDQKLTLLK